MLDDKTGEPDDLGEPPNGERLRRMNEIMNRININEVPVKDLKIPPVKSKNFIIIASLGSVLLLVSSALYKYNWFASAEEDVRSAKGTIENALQLRSNLFSNLVNLTLNQAAMEQETLRYVADTRSKQGNMSERTPLMPGLAPDIKGMGGSVPDALARLMAVSEQYPDIKTSATYKELMDKLLTLEKQIHQRRDEYNEKVRIFNSMTRIFPWQLVAHLWDFRRYPYFESDPHRPDTIEINISSDSFRRLIPPPKGTFEVKSEKTPPATIEVKP
ncbi:putative magnetosome protein MamQ [Gammaproteobacteria bacterium]